MRNVTLALVIALAGSLGVSGCSEGSAGADTGDTSSTDAVALGARKARVCMSCHGPGGISRTASYPSLAGLERDYLARQLRHFKSGERQNPVMQSMVASLSEADIDHLAAFFSTQPAPEETP